MVGGASGRADAVPAVSSTNIFAALGRKKSRKQKSDREKQTSKDSALPLSGPDAPKPAPQAWVHMPTPVTSWADWEDDDDDDFVMPALPPLPRLDQEPLHQGAPEEEEEQQDEEDAGISSDGEESEGYEGEEGNEENREPQFRKVSESSVDANNVGAARIAVREPGRQLSKKELKKKGLAELEAALTELGLNQEVGNGSVKIALTKEGDAHGHGQKSSAVPESKSSKRRKVKKEKALKEGKEEETQDQDGFPTSEAMETNNNSEGTVDKSKVLKKLSSMKKKKSMKDGDSAAKAAASEAAVRAAKLAAAKKKEKAHYNQQPVR